MAVLGTFLLTRRGRAALGLALLAFVGCALVRGGGEDAFAFSHRQHVEVEQLECAMCHEDLALSDEPGMPPLDACELCHAEIDAEEPPERQVAALFEAGIFRAARASALDPEVRFSHLGHVEAGLACGACHAGIEESERVDERVAVSMARCIDCHEERSQAADCATCHSEIDRDWKPESHDPGWIRAHGPQARMGSRVPAQSCSLCHDEEACASCHRIEPPRSHTNSFRRKGHGLLASMDRQSCAVCHEPSSCEACHAQALPMSHGGAWGGSLSLHCLGCHTPLESNGCNVCHKATPSHALAPAKPAWHTPAMNCTQCHGRGLPLPHPDNGENCNLCHF
jgi:hypothetical protein